MMNIPGEKMSNYVNKKNDDVTNFDVLDNDGPVTRQHLGSEFKENISCDHAWCVILNDECREFVISKHDEEDDDDVVVEYCPHCRASALRDREGIFSYDATFQVPETL